jgi:3-dehydroquinate synthase
VYQLYGPNIIKFFNHHQTPIKFVVIDGIEAKKNLGSLYEILTEMESFGISRNSEPVLAIGGGVIQDLVGMACGMYRRGVPYVRIPTTLIGIVDVSVAAKTGINFENRRNRLGSYYPPIASLLDKSFIRTLEPIEISSGLGEILKMAVIKDINLYDQLIRNSASLLSDKFNVSDADYVIEKSIVGMIEELENNLWEKDLKRCVDFGHSFSPIIEMRSLKTDKPLTHGQAVTLDIIFSCCIAVNRGLLTINLLKNIKYVAQLMGLETWHELFTNTELLLEALTDTTKHRGGNQNLPTPTGIGKHIFINDLTYDEICEAVKLFNEIK